ncbi:MAG: NYN domain-containing protein [Candidatus Sifarchaeia archaeon]
MSVITNALDLAVFWDIQNIGAKRESSFAQDLLEFLKKRGRVVAAYAYADWKIIPDETAALLFRNRYELIHIPKPSKNSADVLMTAHAMEHITTAPTVLEYVLISKDYDFRPLVASLQRMGKRVILICRPIDTNPDLLSMVDAYVDVQEIRTEVAESIVEEAVETEAGAPTNKETQKKSAFAQLQETIKEIESRDNQAGIGYTKIVMTSLNPGFDEHELGFERWSEFVGEAEKEGLITLEGEGAATIIGLPKKISRAAKDSLDIVQKGFEFLLRTVKQLEEEGKSPELVLVASRMHTTNPMFNSANLGFRKFYEFVKAAEQRGLVTIEIVPGKEPILHSMLQE